MTPERIEFLRTLYLPGVVEVFPSQLACDDVNMLLDAIATVTARAEAAERDWNDAIGYWHATVDALAAQTARAEAALAALDLTHQALLAYMFPAGATPEELNREATHAIKVATRAMLAAAAAGAADQEASES